jgi:hypothetical protein
VTAAPRAVARPLQAGKQEHQEWHTLDPRREQQLSCSCATTGGGCNGTGRGTIVPDKRAVGGGAGEEATPRPVVPTSMAFAAAAASAASQGAAVPTHASPWRPGPWWCASRRGRWQRWRSKREPGRPTSHGGGCKPKERL